MKSLDAGPAFTAVIRAKDREHTIGRAIDSVLGQSARSEVIVIDSGSRDRTVEVASSRGVRVLQIPADEFSYGGAINLGVEAASSDYVLVLSAHCALPNDDWAASALDHFDDPRVAGLNGFARSAHAPSAGLTAEAALEVGASRDVIVQEHPWTGFAGFSNHASLLRRSVALEFPFDEALPACEDKEWANRVSDAGFRLIYSAQHSVSGTHRRREGLRSLYRRARRESSAMSEIMGHPMWTSADAMTAATRVFRSRRGVRRLAPIRPANVVETVGRVVGARQTASPDPVVTPTARVLLNQVAPLLAGPIDMVNFPLHNNCGDSAIWLGQRALVRELEVGAQVRAFTNILDQFAVREPAPTVLVRGGGYFNDIWPEELRAFFDACERYRGSRMVLMPQTVGKMSETTVEAVRAALTRHGRVTLLLRDQRSVEVVRRLFPGVDAHLSPDAAQCLNKEELLRLGGGRGVRHGRVRVIARSDAEADNSLFAAARERGIPVLDFVGTPSSLGNRAFREAHEIVRARLPRAVAELMLAGVLPGTRLLDRHAEGEVRRAVRLIAGAERVVTDRLHASIIASLLEIEVTAVDTGYGKLAGYFDAWPSPYVSFATDAHAALSGV